MWPLLLDYSRDDCKRMLRKFELEAYSSVVTAFRSQGDLNKDKRKILQDLASLLSISLERHRAEVRRAVNDERLNTIAHYISGPNTSCEWTIEGRRLIPLMPRLVPQTAFTTVANTMANIQSAKNTALFEPSDTGSRLAEMNFDDNYQIPKRRRIESQNQMTIQGPPTIVPIKTSIHGHIQPVSSVSTLSPSHRFIAQSVVSPNAKSNIQRSFISPGNAYTISAPTNMESSLSGGTVAPTRVIFVSSTPTTSPTILTSSTKPSSTTSFPLITRPTIGPVPRPAVQVASPRSQMSKSVRQTTPTTVVGLIGVSGSSKQIKASTIKSPLTLTSSSNVTAVTTIPFPQGTKVYTKTGGQQQVVVFPVNQKPIAVPLNAATKSLTSSVGNTLTNQTIIYQQSSSNTKTVQKVQTPNLIIMQPKQNTAPKTVKPLTSGAVTLTKASVSQQNRPLVSAKRSSGRDDGESSINVSVTPESEEKQMSSSHAIVNLQDFSQKTISGKKIQEFNISANLAKGEFITIDTPSEKLTGILKSVKTGQLTPELMEFVKMAVMEKRENEKEASCSKANPPVEPSSEERINEKSDEINEENDTNDKDIDTAKVEIVETENIIEHKTDHNSISDVQIPLNIKDN